jgi:PKHD-type hydroxylase
MDLKYSYFWFKSALTPETCTRIIELGKSKLAEEEAKGNSTEGYTFGQRQKGALGKDAAPADEKPLTQINSEIGSGNNDIYVRDSKVAWLTDTWLYDLIYPYIDEANHKAGWNWEYDRSESFQFTQYEPSGFYGWHKDGQSDWNGIYKRYIHGVTEEPLRADNTVPAGYVTEPKFVGKVRKISLTINLNEPGEYEGGNLKFDFGVNSNRVDRFHECEEIRPQGSIIVFPSFVDHCVTPVTKGTRYSLVLWTLGDPWK